MGVRAEFQYVVVGVDLIECNPIFEGYTYSLQVAFPTSPQPNPLATSRVS